VLTAGFPAIAVPARPCEEASDAASRQVFLDAVAHGSVISWQHINLLGEYDFSDEKLRDSVEIRPSKLTPKEVKIWGCRTALCASVTGTCRKLCETLRTFVGI
jgi:hypothetical protein